MKILFLIVLISLYFSQCEAFVNQSFMNDSNPAMAKFYFGIFRHFVPNKLNFEPRNEYYDDAVLRMGDGFFYAAGILFVLAVIFPIGLCCLSLGSKMGIMPFCDR